MRLFQIEKDGIIDRTIKGAFKARREKLAEEENALAEKVYQLIYPQDVARKMNQLPEEFFCRSLSVYLMEGKRSHKLLFRESKRVAACDHTWERPQWEARPKIDDRVLVAAKAIGDHHDTLDSDIKAMKEKLRQFLAGISTWKRLEEEWAEGKEYYRMALPTAATQNLPAVTGADVQQMLKNLAGRK